MPGDDEGRPRQAGPRNIITSAPVIDLDPTPGVRQAGGPETSGNPRCPAGCAVVHATPNRKTRRRLEAKGRRSDVIALHADDCPLNLVGLRASQATLAAARRRQRGAWS